jgi:hypothetical protein
MRMEEERSATSFPASHKCFIVLNAEDLVKQMKRGSNISLKRFFMFSYELDTRHDPIYSENTHDTFHTIIF